MKLAKAKELHSLMFTFNALFYEKFFSRFRRHYAENPRIKKNHVKILSILYLYESLIPTEISKMLGIERGSLTTLIDQLEEMGLVNRSSTPKDRRKLLIALSAHGRDELNKVMYSHARTAGVFLEGVEEEELEQFLASMRCAVDFMRKL
ncbi:MAG: MarR family transcriptional regulator [Peptococcaceae bacterium]|jgi:DNA-binding MarR family transcriptional regulator|nr:MarR family transcriptional regulator [Peptococcaceae bacterium]